MNKATRRLATNVLSMTSAAVTMGAALAFAPIAHADMSSPFDAPSTPTYIPPEYKNVGVDEHPNSQVPLDLEFWDEHGNTVTLGSFLHPDKPIVLQLGYYGCPRLCDVISHTLVDSARQIELKPGKDFNFVFVSIDPSEQPILAAQKKQSLVEEYLKPEAAEGFHCLVAHPVEASDYAPGATRPLNTSDALAKAVGFRYNRLDQEGQFSHPAVLFVLTPDGHISRYLYGISIPPDTLELSLVEASKGKVGTSWDKLALLICCYDVETGKYTIAAVQLMRFAAIGTMLAMGGFGFWLFRHGSRTVGSVRGGLPPMDGAGPVNGTK